MNGNPRYTDLVDKNGKSRVIIYSGLAHPNPRFYKCYWQIFHRGSAVEGPAFFGTPTLCTHDAQILMRSLDQRGEGHLIYTYNLPRKGNTPFDFQHPRWADVKQAPAFEDDCDPEWDGHR